MALFYSGKSEVSTGIIDGMLPSLREIYSIEVRLYDVDNPENFALLAALEKKHGLAGSDLPVVFVGDEVIAGEEEIWERLESTVAEYELLGGSDFPEMVQPSGDARALSHSVYMTYFYQRGCAQCDRVGSLVSHLRGKYDGFVVREIDIDTDEGKILNESLGQRMGVPEERRLTAPSVFFPQNALVGEAVTLSALEGLIREYEASEEVPPPWEMAEGEDDRAGDRIVERFKTLGLPTVAVAGLIDGINPCAFATLILFVSYLTFVGRQRREVLYVGLAFSLSVFVTYFLVGLGLLRVLQAVKAIPVVARIVYLATIILALVFGIVSLYDYMLCRRDRASDMLLQMPAFLKNRVRSVIRKEVRLNRYILAAAATGFVVSILELTCTGQVYLPTILFVSKTQELRSAAVGYLALYNVMFIVPLLAVFLVVYFGTRSERLSFLFESHMAKVKLATAAVFFALAGAMSMSLF
jgi:cytochrome c biogenesis protein CcdA